MSKKRTLPALMALRRSLLVWYGVRQSMASARASEPSRLSPVDAPVTTAILNGRPAACSAFACSAMPTGTTFAAPAGVNPLKPTVWPCLKRLPASSFVISGKLVLMTLKKG